MKRFYIETFGCQMNVYDSELVAGILKSKDYEQTGSIDSAEIILINTCAIRERAVERVINKMKQYAHYKKKRNADVMGILGCVPQYASERLKEELPFIDILAGPDSYDKLPEMIQGIKAKKGIKEYLELDASQNYDDILPFRQGVRSAFVTVTRGCNNFCSYCVVPYVRGRERSRTAASVIREINDASDRGVKEITLLGQNVNSYKSGNLDFADLMKKISLECDIERIRFATSHPKDISEKLLRVIEENENICEHLHLPFQSGSNRILERMNRGYTKERYLGIVEKAKEIIPDIALTTDIIVGFPGETEDDHKQTLEVIERSGFDNAFMFIYSERDNTYAKKNFFDDIPYDIKVERHGEVSEVQKRTGLEQMRSEIGKTRYVLTESASKKRKDEIMGRTPQNRIVVIKGSGSDRKGETVKVKITDAAGVTLFGRITE